MTKKLSLNRPNRRDFLRTGLIGGTGLVVAQFAAPKELRASTIWSGQVSASSDDAQENTPGNIAFLTGTTLGVVGAGTHCGCRFTNVTVPQNATITSATISFYVDSVNNSVANSCSVKLQAADNPLTFAATKWNISLRPTTVNGGSFGASTTGWNDSTDISAAVQEVVNRSGWVSGNAMAVITYHGIFFADMVVRAYDYDPVPPPNDAAILTIEYS